MRTWSASAGKGPSCAAQPIPIRCRNCCRSCTPNAAHATRPSNPARSSGFAGSVCKVIMENIKDIVREKYGQAALRVHSGGSSCCGAGAATDCCDPITSNLYEGRQTAGLPETAVLASLGCGNPTALADLHPGETVLDLGSGGGIDVLLSARRVGPTGTAYGLDMTDEMLALAEENRRKSRLTNVHFIKGYIEAIPLPADKVDVIISNCVINLAADKRPVLA